MADVDTYVDSQTSDSQESGGTTVTTTTYTRRYIRTSVNYLPAPGIGNITITTPVSYRTFQRDGSNQVDIVITGTYTGTPGPMEASFNGGAYKQICGTPSGGAFTGTLTAQDGGQGVLSVRWMGNPSSVVTRTLVGGGENFIVGGQSNAVGFTAGMQSYSHPTLKGCMFANDYNYKDLTDPVDDNTNQVDTVSEDDTYGGSCWPPLATSFMANQNVPITFIPCALGSTFISEWLPGVDHQDRSTLYGSMIYRALQVGVRCVLFWIGETDVIWSTDPADFNTDLDTIANAIYSDLGVKLMICKLEDMTSDGYDVSGINGAIDDAWNDNSNVIPGPDFSDTDWPGYHYSSALAVSLVAPRWWAALQTAFGWS